MWAKKIFCFTFFFLPGPFQGGHFFGEIIYLDRPCLKPTPPCSAAISSAALSMFLLLQRWALSRVSNVVRPIFSFEDNRLTTVFTWMPEQCEQPKDDKASSSCCFGWAVVLALKNCGSLWEAVLLALKNWGCVLAFDPVFFRREDWCVTAQQLRRKRPVLGWRSLAGEKNP